MIVVKSINRKMNTPLPPEGTIIANHENFWHMKLKMFTTLNSEYTVVIFLDASLGMMDKIPHKYLEI